MTRITITATSETVAQSCRDAVRLSVSEDRTVTIECDTPETLEVVTDRLLTDGEWSDADASLVDQSHRDGEDYVAYHELYSTQGDDWRVDVVVVRDATAS